MDSFTVRRASTDDIRNFYKKESLRFPSAASLFDEKCKLCISRINNNLTITYYGFLNDEVVCECTAVIKPEVIKNPKRVIDDTTAYLMNIETSEEHQGKGYFSKLLSYVLDDLKTLGYKKVTLSYFTDSKSNEQIYKSKGFTEDIKRSVMILPNGERKELQYSGRKIV